MHALDVLGGGGGHLHAGPHRAGDRDHRRDLVLSTRARPVSRSPQTTLNTPAGKNSWADLGEQQRGHRGGVRRLEHDGVAGRERRGDLPDRHQQRVVPRRDLGADADRLAADRRRCARPCTRRRPGPRAAGRHRRRSASGPRSGRAPRDGVSPSGLPVLRDSTAANSSARASTASASLSSARWRTRGSGAAPLLEGLGGGGASLRRRRPRRGDRGQGDHLFGDRVDDLAGAAVGRVGRLAADDSCAGVRLLTGLSLNRDSGVPVGPSLALRLRLSADLRREERWNPL